MVLTDVIVVGGGIAGLSLAAALAPHHRVVLLEREPRLFTHTSGRSAQQSQPTYGPAPIRRFTATTLRLLDAMPDPLVTPRPLLWLDLDGAPPRLDDLLLEIEGLRRVSVADAVEAFPALLADRVAGAALDPASVEVDLYTLRDRLQASAESHGCRFVLGEAMVAAERQDGDWVVTTDRETYRARTVVIAAGPWADDAATLIAQRRFGLVPTRRTVVVGAVHGESVDPRAPMLMDTAFTFYLRPSGDQILASSLEDEPSVAEDSQPRPEVIDRTLEVVNSVTRLGVGAPYRSWTGLRTLSSDGLPVIGWDDDHAGLYWLVGQGGYGIQTSLGLAEAVAAEIAGVELPPQTAADLAAFAPGRFTA